jgi:AraC-like DNA-binding protein
MLYLFWNRTLLVFLLPLVLCAQVTKKELGQLSYDMLKKSYWDNERNPKQQLVYTNAFLLKAKSENSPVQKARGYFLLSLLSKDVQALRYLDSAIVYTKGLHDVKFPAYAYSGKAYVYKEQFKYKEAIDNFLIAESIAKKNNLDLYYEIKFSIAALRSEELGQVEKALALFKECFSYYKGKKVGTPPYSYAYQNVIFALADAHKALLQSDSATFYNKMGYRESKLTKDNESNALFTLNEGANLVLKRNFRGAIDSINKSLPLMIAYKNTGNTLASYYYYGKAYEGLGKKDMAANNFIKVDSIYKIAKRITPEFMSGYPYLISYYKDKGDKEKQLQYITQYMLINNVLQKNYKELTQKLQKEYDTPHLFSEKEALIQSLKKDGRISKWVIGTLILLLIPIGLFGWYQSRVKRSYRKRFEKVMNQFTETNENTITVTRAKEITIGISTIEDIGILQELVDDIIVKLDLFENANGYLESNISIQTLSRTFETNSKYLSKIVNVYKGKSFIQYINDLRIEHAIMTLKKDDKLTKYTIQALAQEFGFNSAESFSAAFYKKTEIKPTYFIKELTKLNNA